jgi:hypothetical protein
MGRAPKIIASANGYMNPPRTPYLRGRRLVASPAGAAAVPAGARA